MFRATGVYINNVERGEREVGQHQVSGGVHIHVPSLVTLQRDLCKYRALNF